MDINGNENDVRAIPVPFCEMRIVKDTRFLTGDTTTKVTTPHRKNVIVAHLDKPNYVN